MSEFFIALLLIILGAALAGFFCGIWILRLRSRVRTLESTVHMILNPTTGDLITVKDRVMVCRDGKSWDHLTACLPIPTAPAGKAST